MEQKSERDSVYAVLHISCWSNIGKSVVLVFYSNENNKAAVQK